MTTFKKGDRVIYVGKHTFSNKAMMGLLGTVRPHTKDDNVVVEWDHFPGDEKSRTFVNAHYSENLALYNEDVGDLEDDL